MSEAPAPRVLVTGARGFVGRRLVARLRTLAIGEVIEATGPDDDGAGVLRLDVASADAVRALVAQTRPTACIHLAGLTHPRLAAQNETLAWRVNLFGALNLADALAEHAPQSRLLHVSSGDVYGAAAGERALDETAPLAPVSLYAATKAAADLALGARAAAGQPIVRFRPFNHTGPGQAAMLVTAHIASQVAAAERGLIPPVVRVAAPDIVRDFLDVDDVCAAYIAALRAPELPTGAVYNIASGAPRAIGEVAKALIAMSAAPLSLVVDGEARAADVPWLCGDASRAAAELGWRPQRPWTATLQAVLDDWRARVANGEHGNWTS